MHDIVWGLCSLLLILNSSTSNANNAECLVDICFAVDRYVSTMDWTDQLEFVALFSSLLNIESTTSRVGLVSYDEISTLDIRLDQFLDTASLQEAIRNQVYGGTGREIDIALFRLHASCFSSGEGDRVEVPNLAVLLTAGKSDFDAASYQASILRQEATILSVGVGPDENIDYDLLLDIAANSEQVFRVMTFTDLKTNPALILHQVCPGFGDFPRLNRKPELKGPVVENNDFRFDCIIDYNQTSPTDPESIYKIIVLLDGLDSGLVSTELRYPDNVVSISSAQLSGNLGKTLACQVVTFWDVEPIIPSPPEVSNVYWLGIKVSHTDFLLSESDESSEGGSPLVGRAYVYSTVPILCASGVDPCRLELQINSPTMILSGQTGTPACRLWISQSDFHNKTDVFIPERAMQLRPKFMEYMTPPRREAVISFVINPQSTAFNDLWSTYVPDQIEAVVRGSILSPGQCLSTGDPHYTTFDNVLHDILDKGIFEVVKNAANNVYVQAKHHIHSNNNGVNCGVVVASGYNGETEKHIIERCNTDLGKDSNPPLNIVKCQLTETRPITKMGNTYTITAASGDVQVLVTDMGTFFNLEIIILADHIDEIASNYSSIGACGTYDGNSSNEHFWSNCSNINTPCYREWARVKDAETNYFKCGNYTPVSPMTQGVHNHASTTFCSCENGNPACGIGDLKGQGETVAASIPIDVLESETFARSEELPYTDNIIYDYQPPFVETPPLVNSTPPAWGTYNVTEQEATQTCTSTLQNSPANTVCQKYVTQQNIETYMYGCKFDIQYTGDLSLAKNHLSNILSSCKHQLKASMNLTDPENPASDPIFNETMGEFLNVTCLNQCSGQGYCDMGVCVCNIGYIKDDCSLDISIPPSPVQFKDPAMCDVKSRPCTAVTIRANDIGYSAALSCKITFQAPDGTSTDTTYHATMPTPESIRCPLPNLWDLGNTSNPTVYSYQASISNDGISYATVNSSEQRLVWHSDWVWVECMMAGRYIPKMESCVIEGQCHAEGEMRDGVDPCYGCHPTRDPHQWTPQEDIEEDTNLTPWTPYSNCSKDCDYGQSFSTRECTGGCCGYGDLRHSQLCNTVNCEAIEAEQHEGVLLTISGMTIEELVSREITIHQMATDLLNEYTLNHPADFCPALDLETLPSPIEDDQVLILNDTRTAQSFPIGNEDASISMKLITEVRSSRAEDLCQIVATASLTGNQTWLLDSDYMMAALVGLDAVFKQEWGSDVGVTLTNPEEVISTGPNLALILGLVLPIACIIIAVAIAVPLVLKKNKKKNGVSNKDQQGLVNTDIPMEPVKRPDSARSFQNRVSPEPTEN